MVTIQIIFEYYNMILFFYDFDLKFTLRNTVNFRSIITVNFYFKKYSKFSISHDSKFLL
jgi:hypothetical protein